MFKVKFDRSECVGPADADHYMCSHCGEQRRKIPEIEYRFQSECGVCRGQMMSWDWLGWKDNPARQLREKERERLAREEREKPKEPVPQDSEPLSNFTAEERTIHHLVTVEEWGTEAPWLSPFGACLVKVFGMKRHEGKVLFGIGNEKPPILGWVEASAFFNEWPD